MLHDHETGANRTVREAVHAAFVITALVVVMAMAMTAAATSGWPPDMRLQGLTIAAWVSAVIGAIFAGWFAASLRAVVRHNDTVDRLARTDELTGLGNRRAFLANALREANRGAREENLALLVLDIDHFKRINDTHGHGVGDLVLAGVARVLSRCVGEAGTVGRMGGEEFAVLLPGCDLDAAERAAEIIRAAIDFGSGRNPRRRHRSNHQHRLRVH